MPWTRGQTARIFAAMVAPWRRAFGQRAVHRTVQGVDLELPYSHLLPIYARLKPAYGQNLVELAAGLAARAAPSELPLQVVDIGANIGDSALQIVARTGARVLCVEGDPYWARYLHRNVDPNSSVTTEEVLLTAGEEESGAARPVRGHGTTRFVPGSGGSPPLPATSAGELRSRHAEFDRLRLVKSDTDGYDTVLVPQVAAAWGDCAPVLFFEFDPELTRVAGHDPGRVWNELAALGYTRLAVWDNAGDPLGQLDIGDAAAAAKTLEPRPVELGYHFWDVAACRADDVAALAVFAELVPQRFDVRGTLR